MQGLGAAEGRALEDRMKFFLQVHGSLPPGSHRRWGLPRDGQDWTGCTVQGPARRGGGGGFSPGRHCWQTPGLAAGRRPWPPQCPSSRRTPCPTRGTRSSPPAPPLGPRRGFGPRSGAAVEEKEGMVTGTGRQVDAPLWNCLQSQSPQGRGSCLRHRTPASLSTYCVPGIVPSRVFCIRCPSPALPQPS